jgi:single-strand DNA-binding protein
VASYNRVILIGNLTRDPELRYTPAGKAVTELGLAVNDRRKGPNGDWIDETTFVDVTLWERQAEVASEYLSKGSPVLIEGRLKLDTWEKDGKKNSKLRVVGDKMQLLGTKGGGGGGSGGGGGAGGGAPAGRSRPAPAQRDEYDAPSGGSSQGGGSHGGDDDIPF